MTEADVEVILQRARELFPDARPRIISDNGSQFIARDFKEFIRIAGMTHVRISPGYPQANGKKERWYQSLKRECIRPQTPLSLEDARRIIGGYVEYYNNVRLHSALGYVTPKDTLDGKEEEIFNERDRKLEAAREERRRRREALRRQQASGSDASPDVTQQAQVPQEAPPPCKAGSYDTAVQGHPPENRTTPRPRRIEHLHALRNDIDIRSVITDLGIPTRNRGTRLSFRCPKCTEYHTAINPRTNLARCFRCQKNFNPIDLVMAERRSTFLEAVAYLENRACLTQ
jgi:hypothetical protein